MAVALSLQSKDMHFFRLFSQKFSLYECNQDLYRRSIQILICYSALNVALASDILFQFGDALFKDWLLDDSLHETFEIRKKNFLINLIDFNPLHTFRQSFTGISPLK